MDGSKCVSVSVTIFHRLTTMQLLLKDKIQTQVGGNSSVRTSQNVKCTKLWLLAGQSQSVQP